MPNAIWREVVVQLKDECEKCHCILEKATIAYYAEGKLRCRQCIPKIKATQHEGIPLNNIRPDGQVTDGPDNMLDVTKPNRQEQIDKICFKFLKWDKTSIGVYMDGTESWYWRDLEKKQSISRTFDPFTNPADCAKVMDEARSRDMAFRLIVMKKNARCHFPQENQPTIVGYATEWMEAFCLALLDAIE